MSDYQLNLIRQYCDTTGVRLSHDEKDLLCKVLEDTGRYNGYLSKEYIEERSGRDYRDTWASTTTRQYRINIDSTLSIDEWYHHMCDGRKQNAQWNRTDIREILEILKIIEHEL